VSYDDSSSSVVQLLVSFMHAGAESPYRAIAGLDQDAVQSAASEVSSICVNLKVDVRIVGRPPSSVLLVLDLVLISTHIG
jgi:hypothetical protein